MPNESKVTIELLHQMGLTPLDWVDAKQFATLTGIAEQKLTHRKQAWPENVVWMKQSGNLYYSIRGYNQWMTEQADILCRKASGLDQGASKFTLGEMVPDIKSHSRTQSLQRASVQLLELDAT